MTLLRNRVFWADWMEKFNNNTHKYITPSNGLVVKESEKVKQSVLMGDIEKAMKASDIVFENIEYKLSERWKTPKETLEEAAGDCEDVTFLLASMLPNLGIEESKIQVGRLETEGGHELHTWNMVDGKVIDGTGMSTMVDNTKYKPVNTWLIRGKKGGVEK